MFWLGREGGGNKFFFSPENVKRRLTELMGIDTEIGLR